MKVLLRTVLTLGVLAGLGYLAWLVQGRLDVPQEDTKRRRAGTEVAPVELAPIVRGRIERKRVFSGTLEASAEMTVAPKIGGRIERLAVDLAEPVRRNQTVCWIDDDELQQTVNQLAAEKAVADAKLIEAQKALAIATRGLRRVEQLKERGIASEVRYDEAAADQLAKEAAVAVATAQVTKATAAEEAARIRAAYAEVQARWTGGDDTRVVAERFVDQGQTVAANTPLYRIIDLDPLRGVLFVGESDYGRLAEEQAVTLATDAWPGESFSATVRRVAPVFLQNTRQARVELAVPNNAHKLRPGMFIRATVVLEAVEGTAIVPESALTQRKSQAGVFVVGEHETKAHWRPVKVGIRSDGLVQVAGEGLVGRVVTLGQQLIADGSPVSIPDAPSGSASDKGSQ